MEKPAESEEAKKERLNRIKGGAFLAGVASIGAVVGFTRSLAAVKKVDPKCFEKGVTTSAEVANAGAILALRALGWGTAYAIGGTGLLSYGIWKLSGAKDLKDFRLKMGELLPRIPKNDPPRSRTIFTGVNDLLTYISTEKFGDKPVIEDFDIKASD